MKNARFFSWNLRDFVKGLIMAILGMIVSGLYNAINIGAFPATWTDWKPIVLAGIGAGLAYVLKNFFTNSEDKFLIREPKKEEQA